MRVGSVALPSFNMASMGLFFFFKQKTAYEMRISDWSSDVCSSDLRPLRNRITQHSCSHLTLVISGPLAKRSPRPPQPPTSQNRPPRRLGRLPSKPFHKIAPSSSHLGSGQRDLAATPLGRHGRGAQPSRKPPPPLPLSLVKQPTKTPK